MSIAAESRAAGVIAVLRLVKALKKEQRNHASEEAASPARDVVEESDKMSKLISRSALALLALSLAACAAAPPPPPSIQAPPPRHADAKTTLENHY
ncbi:hypothetical protein [Lichenihabitans psoromatis]|uniref:hypothetical protein n=1 Tax=Lichenihabitans psoromatis TaxID=2528642 RepID=UPI0013F173E2|nr:hypothetical protein [Lichenihabitans psoromatis]